MSSPISSLAALDPAFAGENTGAPATKSKGELSKETFMTLLVAQIKHQDPLNPADGVEFMTQLAQFNELEQMLNMNQELTAIRQELEKQNQPVEVTPFIGDKHV